MSNFLYTRPGGVWNTDTDLLATELADIDSKTVRAVNGEGGTYYLADPLIIGGSGTSFFEVGVEARFGADATFSGDTFLNGPIYHYGSSAFFAPAEFNNETTFSGDLTANNDTFLNGAIYHYGTSGFYDSVFFEAGSDPIFSAPATFNQPVDINSSVDVSGGLTITGLLVASGAVSLGSTLVPTVVQGPLQVSGPIRPQVNGRLLEPGVDLPNANATIDIRSTKHFFIPSFGSTTRTYTVDSTGLEDGDWFQVYNASSGLQSFTGAVFIDVLPLHGFKAVRVLGSWRFHQWVYTT